MLFVIYCRDKEGSQPVRLDNREAHLAYVDSSDLEMVVAGPLLTPDGDSMIGSMLVVDAEDRARVDAFAASDPYRLAGLFESVEIHPFRQVFPRNDSSS
jgi:uncharacterized protein YciI